MAKSRIPCGFHECRETFREHKDRTKHLKDKHNNVWPCGYKGCNQAYKGSFMNLKLHKDQHQHWTSHDEAFPCQVKACTTVCRTAVELREHSTSAHPETYPFLCDECGLRFLKSQRLVEHKRVHKNKDRYFSCPYTKCTVKMTRATSVARHIAVFHHQELPCGAHSCDGLFDNEKDLKDHQSLHTQHTPYMCNDKQCREAFATFDDLHEHEHDLHSRSLCVVCEKTFSTPLQALLHAAQEHYPAECSLCSYSFTRTSSKAVTLAERHFKIHVIFSTQPEELRCVRISAESSEDKGDRTVITPEYWEAGQPTAINTIAVTTDQDSDIQHIQPVLAYLHESTDAPSTASMNSEGPLEIQFTAGRKLRRFRDMIRARPNPTSDAGRTIEQLLEGPVLQVVSCKVKKSDQVKKLEFSNASTPASNPLAFDITHLNLDSSSTKTLGRRLEAIFQRIPQAILKLPPLKLQSILQAATVSVAKDLSTRPRLQAPKLEISRHESFYNVSLGGYDPNTGRSFTAQVKLSKVPKDLKYERSELAAYNWQDRDSSSGSDENDQTVDEDLLATAKLLYTRFNGWIGTKKSCLQAARSFRCSEQPNLRGRAFKSSHRPSQTPGRRVGSIFYHKATRLTEISAPALWAEELRLPVKHLSLSLPTDDPLSLFPVVTQLQKAARDNLPAEDTWALTCAAADACISRLREEVPPEPIMVCEGCKGIHLCPQCWFHRKCETFLESSVHDFKVCDNCAEKEPEGSNIMSQLRHMLHTLILRDNKASGKNLSTAECTQLLDDICKELEPFNQGDDDSVVDNLVDQVLLPLTITNTKLSWYGHRLHPKTPSIDAFHPVFESSEQTTGYHLPGNVTPVSDSINRLMRHYPKLLLYAIHYMVVAEDQATYDKGLAIFRNMLINATEMTPFSDYTKTRRLGLPLPENWEDIQESFRSGRLMQRTLPKRQIWRTLPESSFKEQPETWQMPDLSYIEEQVRLVAQSYGLDGPEFRRCWLRDGVFFPFAMGSVTLRWTWWDCYRFFASKLKRMRDQCDHLYKDSLDRPDCSVGELIITVAHLWMRNVRRDHFEKNLPLELCGRDELGLIPHPTIGWLLASSIGHLHHGRQMATGLSGFDPVARTNCSFDANICNICWETQACNNIKYAYNEDYYEEIVAQVLYPRSTPLSYAPVSLPPPETIDCTLRDEVNFPDPKGSAAVLKAIEEDEDQFYSDLNAHDSEEDMDDEEDQPELRCFCGEEDSLSDEEDFDQLIQCTICKAYQHKSCRDAEYADPDLYLCEICEPDEGEQGNQDKSQLEPIIEGDEGEIERITPLKAPVAASQRNMARTQMSCYISSPVQLACRLSEIAAVLQQPFGLRITGREPHQLDLYDPTPGRQNYKTFFSNLQAVYNALQIGGDKSEKKLTQNLLESSGALHHEWQDTACDAVEYWTFMMDLLSIISDQSSFTSIEGGMTAEQRFKQRLEDRIKKNQPFDEPDANFEEALEAWRKSGHDNSIANATTLHIVTEGDCARCLRTTREFRHISKLQVTIPENLEDEEIFDPLIGVKTFFTELQPDICPAPHNTVAAGGEKWASASACVMEAPQILVVEINRSYNKGKQTLLKRNRVLENDSFDLAEFGADRYLPSMSYTGLTGSTKYRRVGVLGYMGDFSHWVAAIRDGPENKGNWVYYDDTLPTPRYLAPDLLPADSRFAEGLIVYRKEAGSASIEKVAAAASEPAPGHQSDTFDFLSDDLPVPEAEVPSAAVAGEHHQDVHMKSPSDDSDPFGLFGDDDVEQQTAVHSGTMAGENVQDLQMNPPSDEIEAHFSAFNEAQKKLAADQLQVATERRQNAVDRQQLDAKQQQLQQQSEEITRREAQVKAEEATLIQARQLCSLWNGLVRDPAERNVTAEDIQNHLKGIYRADNVVRRYFEEAGIAADGSPTLILSGDKLVQAIESVVQQASARAAAQALAQVTTQTSTNASIQTTAQASTTTTTLSQGESIQQINSLLVNLDYNGRVALLSSNLVNLATGTSPGSIMNVVYRHIIRPRIVQQLTVGDAHRLIFETVTTPMWNDSSLHQPSTHISSRLNPAAPPFNAATIRGSIPPSSPPRMSPDTTVPPADAIVSDQLVQQRNLLPKKPVIASPVSVNPPWSGMPGYNHGVGESQEDYDSDAELFGEPTKGAKSHKRGISTQEGSDLETPRPKKKPSLTSLRHRAKEDTESSDEELFGEPRKGAKSHKRGISTQEGSDLEVPNRPKKKPSLTSLRERAEKDTESPDPLAESPSPAKPLLDLANLPGKDLTAKSVQGDATKTPSIKPPPTTTRESAATGSMRGEGLSRSKSVRSLRSNFDSPTASSLAKSKFSRARPTASSVFSYAQGSNYPTTHSTSKVTPDDQSLAQRIKRTLKGTVQWGGGKKEQPQPGKGDDDSDGDAGHEDDDDDDEDVS